MGEHAEETDQCDEQYGAKGIVLVAVTQGFWPGWRRPKAEAELASCGYCSCVEACTYRSGLSTSQRHKKPLPSHVELTLLKKLLTSIIELVEKIFRLSNDELDPRTD